MAWLGEGLSSLKGQITNFTKEVLSEVAESKEDSCGHESQLQDAEEKIQRLESLCLSKDLEISKLREQNAALELQARPPQNQTRKHHPLLYHVGSSPNLGGNFTYGDSGNGTKEGVFDFSSMEAEKDDLVDYLRAEIRALKIEKEKVEKKVECFQKKCSCLEVRGGSNVKTTVNDCMSASDEVSESEIHNQKNKKTENSSDGVGINLQDIQQPFQEIKFTGGEPLDARGECDGSEEIPKEVVKLMDQISELTASLSDAQLNVNQLQENEKGFVREIQRLKNEVLEAEDNVKSLSLEVETAQEYNSQLEQKLEELDKQNSATIDQLMAVVSSVKSENEVLEFGLKELEKKSQSLESELQSCLFSSKTQRREIELELEKEVLKFIPPELIPREPRSSSGGGEMSVVVGAVRGLAKASEEHRWKRDALERKLSEVMKEMREVKAECLLLRGEAARRDNGAGLRATEGLAPILETGEEEDEEDDEAGDSLPKDAQQAGANDGGDVCDGRGMNWQSRCLVLEQEIKRLTSERASSEQQKDLDVVDVDDEDGDGIEEANDWTWQAADREKTPEPPGAKLLGNIFVKDGEHVITTIPNDIGIAGPLETCGECIGSSRDDVPTLTEQYMEEKLKLERVIRELQEEKGSLERTLEDSRENILNMEEKIKALSANLNLKTKSETELLYRENELKNQLSELETKINSFENLVAGKNESIRELETEVTLLKNDLLTERKCNGDVKQCMVNLKAHVSELESSLKCKDEFLNENEKLVNDLEERLKVMERNVMEGKEMREECSKLVACLEAKVVSLQTALELEVKLKEEALREIEEARRMNEGLERKVASEVVLKEEALNKLASVEDRYRSAEQSVHQETISKDELNGRITELEMMMSQIKEEARLEQSLKDEAAIRAGRLEVQLKHLDEELSTSKGNLQEKDVLICDLVEKIKSLEMERERIMCVVGDKAREVSSLRSEKQHLMEAISSMEKLRQKELSSEPTIGARAGSEGADGMDGSANGTTTPPGGERERMELDDDGTMQLLTKLNNLQLESEQLAESYRQEQMRNKHLQNEVHELLEKETALQDELQRLRLHLIGVEDRYTKEAVNAEERISFLKTKLTQVEERLHASSSAYTSASVRSNQQVESLENQVRMLTEKRDESKGRLIAAEEQLAQQAKDLINLQTVLEQFQKDKDREISLVKEKMGVEMSSWERKCCGLSEEIGSLKEQLNQAKEGLSAAARLSEQADKKSEIIASLKTELKKLNASLISAEERLQNASLNVEGKVDRYLVKNLLLGYLTSPTQGSRRYEILRIIATILEFSQEEKAKADLLDGSGKGWLRGLAGWGGHNARDPSSSDLTQPASSGQSGDDIKTPAGMQGKLLSLPQRRHGETRKMQPSRNVLIGSLSEAFIKFLESESRPKSVPQLHMISESRAESTRSSTPASTRGHSRTPSTSSTPPLLLSESVLPTLPTFSVASGSNSSCILKDVLKDS